MTSQWRRDRDRQPERRPALPIWPMELSNGEFLPRPPSASDREVTRQVIDRIDLAAARTGWDRRRFLTRSGAVAATLSVLNSCASGDGGAGPPIEVVVRRAVLRTGQIRQQIDAVFGNGGTAGCKLLKFEISTKFIPDSLQYLKGLFHNFRPEPVFHSFWSTNSKPKACRFSIRSSPVRSRSANPTAHRNPCRTSLGRTS